MLEKMFEDSNYNTLYDFLDQEDYLELTKTLLSSGDISDEKIAYVMSRVVHHNLDDVLELFLRYERTTDEDCRKAFKVALHYESVKCVCLLLQSGRLKHELIVDIVEQMKKDPRIIIYNDLVAYSY